MGRPAIHQKPPLCLAVIQLRNTIGESQEKFKDRLGVSMPSLARYETTKQPTGKILAKLADIADDNNSPLLADVFRLRLTHELGIDPNTRLFPKPQTEEEEQLVDALLRCLRTKKHARTAASLKRLLTRVREETLLSQEFGMTAFLGNQQVAENLIFNDGWNPVLAVFELQLSAVSISQLFTRCKRKYGAEKFNSVIAKFPEAKELIEGFIR